MVTDLKSRLTGRQVAIGAAVAIVLCLVSGILLYSSVERFKFSGPGYYPSDSMIYEVQKGDTAELAEGEDYATLELEGQKVPVTDNAVYYTDRKGLALLCPWELVTTPQNGKPGTYRLNCFTEVEQSGRSFLLKAGQSAKVAQGAFLFNGQDTYILLEDGTLEINGKKTELPAFSYVIVNRANYVQYTDHDTKEYVYVDIDGSAEISLSLKNSGIDVKPVGDLMEYSGRSFMLLSEISFLDEYGEQ